MGEPPRAADTAPVSIERILLTVATRLKDARQQLKMTQKQVAEKAELQQSYVYEIETGKTNVTLRTLAKLAEVLRLDIRTLFPVTNPYLDPTNTNSTLYTVLDKTLVVLQDYEKQDAERHRRQAELLAELQSIMRLRIPVETPPPPVQKLGVEVSITEAKGTGAKRADRTTKSH